MRLIQLPWKRKARARAAVLAAAREWQEAERHRAYARIVDLAATDRLRA